MDGPNPFAAGLSVLGSLRVARPRPSAKQAGPRHDALGTVLGEVRRSGISAIPGLLAELGAYTAMLGTVDPDRLGRDDALAYWLNLYNAGALTLAGRAFSAGEQTVLRLPGAFTRSFTTVAGSRLSLDQVEHGKIRRFRDPRIHTALVCGSASCPTLRYEPYEGSRVQVQLDDQTRSFLEAGASVIDGDRLLLSRVFLWYGGDFVRPHRMPTFLPVSGRRVAAAISRWLPEAQQQWLRSTRRRIGFQAYDWSLACSVRKPA